MFDDTHYVPVLRWKSGERGALRDLSANDRLSITPLIERHEQYLANAELLCARKEFGGAHYSSGDEYIWNIGSHKQPGPGTPETWLRAGINRHLALTARQIPGAVAMTA